MPTMVILDADPKAILSAIAGVFPEGKVHEGAASIADTPPPQRKSRRSRSSSMPISLTPAGPGALVYDGSKEKRYQVMRYLKGPDATRGGSEMQSLRRACIIGNVGVSDPKVEAGILVMYAWESEAWLKWKRAWTEGKGVTETTAAQRDVERAAAQIIQAIDRAWKDGDAGNQEAYSRIPAMMQNLLQALPSTVSVGLLGPLYLAVEKAAYAEAPGRIKKLARPDVLTQRGRRRPYQPINEEEMSIEAYFQNEYRATA